MIGIIIRTAFEVALVVLLIIGFMNEKKIIKFEEDLAWFYNICKENGYSTFFFIKTILKACGQTIKERVGK